MPLVCIDDSPVKVLTDMSQDNIIEIVYKIKNGCSHPITPGIVVSCGCTAPELRPVTIPVGETALLVVRFNPQGRKGLNEKAVGLNYVEEGENKTLNLTFIISVI